MKTIDFTGRVVLVTGAGQGIGYKIAVEMANCGANLTVVDLKMDEEHSVVKEIKALGVECLPISANVASEEDVINVFAAIKEKFGKIDVLVNNAGITRDAMCKNMTAEQFKMVLDVNLFGTFLCSQKAMALMSETETAGSIINFSSVTGFRGNIGQANYVASKAGIMGMTKTLALESAKRKIRVNAVAPGFIETPMTAGMPEKAKENAIAQIPLLRIGYPEDVANAVVFLASDMADFITGQCIHVNGGRYM